MKSMCVCIQERERERDVERYRTIMSDQVTIHLTNTSDKAQDSKNGADFKNILGNGSAGKKPVAVSLRHVTVEHSFPNISTHNNTLIVNGVAYSLTVGQYSTTQLLASLNTLFGGDLEFAEKPHTYTSPNIGLLQVRQPTGAPQTTITLPATISVQSGSLSSTLGYTEDVTITAQNVWVPGQHNRNLAGPRMLLLHSRRLGHGNCIHSDGQSSNVIESIDLGGTPYGGLASKIIAESAASMITFDGEEELSDVDVFVTDERLRKLVMGPNNRIDLMFRAIHKEDKR